MAELSQRSRKLLAAYHESQQELPVAHQEALLGRLNAQLAAGVRSVAIDTTVPTLPGVAARAWALLPKVWLGSVLLLGPAVYIAVNASSPPRADPARPIAAAAPPAGDAESLTVAPSSEPLLTPLGSEPEKPRRPRRARRPSPAPSEPSVPALALAPPAGTQVAVDTIDAELLLLQKANRELRGGDSLAALATLAELAGRFPDGKLSEARILTKILALCAAGKQQQARREAGGFLHAYAQSPYADRVRRACPAEP